MLVLLLYVAIFVPLFTFFDIKQSAGHLFWDVLVDLLFISDIYLNFRTGFVDKTKTMVRMVTAQLRAGATRVPRPRLHPYPLSHQIMDKKIVRRRYLRSCLAGRKCRLYSATVAATLASWC